MAEHQIESGRDLAREKSLGSSLSSGDLPRVLTEAGGKSPTKTRKTKKVSLFKKTHDEGGGGFMRSSGRGRRKSGREKKLDVKDVPPPQPQEENHSQHVEAPVSLPIQPSAETCYQYELGTQEIEQKSTGDLSVKKVQKLNKELAKLQKSVDSLKKEKDILVSEKVKLKSENKTLEKELKKVNSKDRLIPRRMSQSTLDESAFDSDVLKERLQTLEDQLLERDRIATLLKMRLDKSQMEFNESSEFDDLERSLNSVRGTRNGSVLDPTVALEMLLEEHDVSLRLRRENEELKSRMWLMEEAKGQQRDLPSQHSPKSPRKRSSGFFKRGKKSTSSMPSRHNFNDDSKHEFPRSQSPDRNSFDPLSEQMDLSASPPLLRHYNKDSTTSLPNQSSPNLSPRMSRHRAREEILTLQSCLKLAIEEKNTSNETKALMAQELEEAKIKILETEESLSASEAQSSVEIERLKKFLKAAEIERDTFHDELKIAQSDIDELTEKREEIDRSHQEEMDEKNGIIRKLEQELESIKKSKITSPTSSKPPFYNSTSSPKRQPFTSPSREKLFSPSKDATFSKFSSESSSSDKSSQGSKQPSFERTRERLSSHDLSKSRERNSSSDLSTVKEVRAASEDVVKPRERMPSSDYTKARERLSSSDSSKQRDRLSSSDLSKSRDKTSSSELSKKSSSSELSKKSSSSELSKKSSSSELSKKSSSSDLSKKSSSSDLSKKSSSSELSKKSSSSDLSKSRERTSSSDLNKSRERLASSDLPKTKERLSSSSDQQKTSKLSREKSQDKLTSVPPSPTRKVGRLSRESSIDRFETPPKEVKRKVSNSGISSPSLAFSPKVSATRAMFEQKIDDSKSDLKRTPNHSSLFEQRRKSIATITPVKDTKETPPPPMHSKSYSYDYSAKDSLKTRKASESSTGSSDKPEPTSPTNAMGRVNGAKTVSNEVHNKVNSSVSQSQQQEKTHTVTATSAAARKENNSSPASKSSESGAKFSRIVVTSVSSPSNSPVLTSRKEISSSREEQVHSPLLSRHMTSPVFSTTATTTTTKAVSPTSTSKGTTSQANNTTRVSTVSTVVRHTNPHKSATMTEISTPAPSKTHTPVTKSQTESKLQAPNARTSGIWSNSTHVPQITTSTISSTPSPNRVVIRTTSKLGGNLLSSSNKSGGSLQDISAQAEDASEKSPPENPSSSTSSTVNASSVVRRGPVHKAIQRRERKDRPKTMYAGRAETTNLVNLISQFQEKEKEKLNASKTSSVSILSSPRAVSPNKHNGTCSPTPVISSSASTTRTVNFSSSSTSSNSSGVTMRQHGGKDRLPRPTSYCSTNSTSIKSGLSFQAPPPYSSSGSSKPPPHERILQRSRTVAGGLGSKQSKKAMLLKWCQMVTQEYENVTISNFAESFSNGLAFCAMMHHFLPDQVPFNTLHPDNRESNFKIAFQAAEGVGIPSLLDVEDMVSLPTPDWMSVMTYVSFIYNKFGQQQNQQQNQQQLHSSMV